MYHKPLSTAQQKMSLRFARQIQGGNAPLLHFFADAHVPHQQLLELI